MAAPTEPNKIIYSMVGVSKRYDQKVVLKEIYLSYFYGAKIGVLGLNGSGKSTLLKILAGVDKNIDGQCVLQPGYTLGYLAAGAASSTIPKPSARSSSKGAQKILDLLKGEQINEKFVEPMDDEQMNKLLEKQGKVQEQLDHYNAWDPRSATRNGDGRPALARLPMRLCGVLSGGERRRVALCLSCSCRSRTC